MGWNFFFYSCFITTLFGCLLPAGLYTFTNFNIVPIFFFCSFFIILVPVCFEFSELIFAFFHKKSAISKKITSKCPKVALLYLTRDDAVEDCLKNLYNQNYKNFEIFILDDSQDEYYQKMIDQTPHKVIRRNTLQGYKAGNLNNWLYKFGNEFDFFVILDSDSLIPSNFIQEMVWYSNHPNNKDIAIFQSKIIPWNQKTVYSKIIKELALTRMCIIEGVGNRLNMVFSFGHNNFHRTDCIMALGGFDENLSPEDLSITFQLSEWGKQVKIIDLISYDSTPDSFLVYKKRLIRWAKQTVEIFRKDWGLSSFSLRLLAVKNLFSYLSIFLCPILLLSSIWLFKKSHALSTIEYIYLMFKFNYAWFILLSFIPFLLLLLNQILIFIHGKNYLLPFKNLIYVFIINVSISFFCWGEVFLEMAKTVFGHKTNFIPTNSKQGAPRKKTIFSYFYNHKYGLTLILLASVGILLFPFNFWTGLNFLWLPLLWATPFILLKSFSKSASL